MPGLLSSPMCLTVIWFLSWSLPPSRAQIWTDEVSDVQFGRLESNVTLACGKSQNSIPVVWRHNHSSVLSWHQVTFDGRLTLFRVDQSAQGNYSCYDNSGLLLHSVILRLGHPPGLLSISCQVPNHTHVRCSWRDSVKTFLPAKYNASFRGKGKEWRPCIVDFTNRHCDVQEPAFWQTVHTLRVIETNSLGSQTTYVNLRLNEHLKPEPPHAVSVKEVEGYPTKLKVSWRNPPSWPEENAFPLLFQIRYRPQGSMHWSEMLTENNAVEITDALAGHSHQVQVRARDEVNSESQWSEWSPLSLLTPWQADSCPDPSDDPIYVDQFTSFSTQPETSTSKTHGVQGDEGNLGLVILLVLFSIFILTTILSLIFVVWMRQKRREHATKQELASMVKMKSIPI
ncbi:interleukin-11 receptor subunit alpha isoform 1-T1 [Anableps anableps]